ncbi:hypothetical protein KIL84_019221 [Mauremys mutica]|uniref:Uncharacterized protein n=1 Tax=Mauremys mutica TaxID=74926 RepID=A0A9D3XUX5_9SAUR|nr:hypothetical protein KIL84_019221 [Mauremys mutica]
MCRGKSNAKKIVIQTRTQFCSPERRRNVLKYAEVHEDESNLSVILIQTSNNILVEKQQPHGNGEDSCHSWAKGIICLMFSVSTNVPASKLICKIHEESEHKRDMDTITVNSF